MMPAQLVLFAVGSCCYIAGSAVTLIFGRFTVARVPAAFYMAGSFCLLAGTLVLAARS